jgi:uncharacterized membrane protein
LFDLYTSMKFVHVMSAIAWVGGGVMLDMLIAKARREGAQAEMVSLLARTERFGKTSIGDIFAAPWVSTGFLAVFISAGLGMGYLTPKSAQLRTMIEARGMKDPEVAALGSRMMLVSRIDLVILTIAVALMVFKPGAV